MGVVDKEVCDARNEALHAELKSQNQRLDRMEDKLDLIIEKVASSKGFRQAFPYMFSVVLFIIAVIGFWKQTKG